MNEITNDTRRALEIIKPVAQTLDIDVRADGSFLYVDNIGIGIGGNSTYATLNEFIGYAFLKRFCTSFRPARITISLEEKVKRYWFTRAQLRQLKYQDDGIEAEEDRK